MAKAIFTKPVGYTPLKGPVGWHADPGREPQSFPEEFIAYAVAAGAATRVEDKAEAAPAGEPKK